MPRRRIESRTPLKGSPVLKVAIRMSPDLGLSGLSFAKRRVREEVGSRVGRCMFCQSWRGNGYLRAVEGGEGMAFMGGTGVERCLAC